MCVSEWIETIPTTAGACCSVWNCGLQGLINNLRGIVTRGNKQAIYLGGNWFYCIEIYELETL